MCLIYRGSDACDFAARANLKDNYSNFEVGLKCILMVIQDENIFVGRMLLLLSITLGMKDVLIIGAIIFALR